MKQELLWCYKVVEKWLLLHFGKLVCPWTDCVDRQCQSEGSAKKGCFWIMPQFDLLAGKKANRKFRQITDNPEDKLNYLCYECCVWVWIERGADPVLYLAEGDIDIRNRETPPPPSLHISSQIYLSMCCICICTISMDKRKIRERNIKCSDVKKIHTCYFQKISPSIGCCFQ